MEQVYQRGKAKILPYDEIDPRRVAQMATLARALVFDFKQFVAGSGYSEYTVRQVIRGVPTLSTRIRTDFYHYSKAILQQHKQTFFDYAEVTPAEIPETVYPYRVVGAVEMPADFIRNRPNPYPLATTHYAIWNLLYLSVRPGNSPYIHFYGQPLIQARTAAALSSGIPLGIWLEKAVNGPMGYINGNTMIANPTVLDYLAEHVDLTHNVWGNSLRVGQPDVIANPVAVRKDVVEQAGNKAGQTSPQSA